MNKIVNPSTNQPLITVLEFDTNNGGKLAIPAHYIISIREVLGNEFGYNDTPERDEKGSLKQMYINQNLTDILITGYSDWLRVRVPYQKLFEILYKGRA